MQHGAPNYMRRLCCCSCQVAIKKIPNAFNDLTDALRILREIKLMRHFNVRPPCVTAETWRGGLGWGIGVDAEYLYGVTPPPSLLCPPPVQHENIISIYDLGPPEALAVYEGARPPPPPSSSAAALVLLISPPPPHRQTCTSSRSSWRRTCTASSTRARSSPTTTSSTSSTR